MRRKKGLIFGMCILFCMINISGCVKKDNKKFDTNSSVDNVIKEKTGSKKQEKKLQNTKNKEDKNQQERNSQDEKNHRIQELILILQI